LCTCSAPRHVHDDLHPDLKTDYIRANPPFNVSDWGSEKLHEDIELARGGPTMAPESSAAPPEPPEREDKDWAAALLYVASLDTSALAHVAGPQAAGG
jgi:type I restriction-modification system DNA methylase subunit